jgi:hypothetical protein
VDNAVSCATRIGDGSDGRCQRRKLLHVLLFQMVLICFNRVALAKKGLHGSNDRRDMHLLEAFDAPYR